jgi:hypothetical protein
VSRRPTWPGLLGHTHGGLPWPVAAALLAALAAAAALALWLATWRWPLAEWRREIDEVLGPSARDPGRPR